MTELLTSAQMRGIEAAAMTSGRLSGLDLMEAAGAAVVQAIAAQGLPLAGAVVLCGPGNNGGDGYVIARLLAARGCAVRVHALADPVTPDAREMRRRWDGPVQPVAALDWPGLADRPLVVDAMFGAGLARDVKPGVWGLLVMAQESGCPLVAVDIPSGLCADSGRIRSASGYTDHPVDLTVTFQRPRPGHFLEPAATLCGALVVADIGLEPELDALLRSKAGDAVVDLTRPGLQLAKVAGHKYAHGHALILAGGPGEGGAARLSARGALRIGAGLVTVACPLAALSENAARLDGVMLRPMRDGAALERLLDDKRFNALCLGPGMGHERARDLVPVALASGRAVVLDADALSAHADAPAALFGGLHRGCILTPHGGEFARLFPDLARRMRGPEVFSKLDATRAAAARAGCVVLFKGPDTVIAAPDGRCLVNAGHRERSAPWLATAGSGDVLAGFIAGLLARGLAPLDAAGAAAWLHVDCARRFGPGLIAEDLPEQLPGVFRALGL